VTDSLWFTTRSGLLRGGADERWRAAAEYADPLARLLERRYRWIPEGDRDDLVQEVVIEIQGALAERHDPSRGKFRALLQAVLARHVADRARKRRPEPLSGEAESSLAAPPDEDDVRALDLETALVAAVREARDRLTQGKARDQDALYALVDRVVHGRADGEIARREGVSADAVARRLERARDEVFLALVRREVGLEEGTPALALAAEAFKDGLRRPREERERLAALPASARPEEVGALLARVRAALPGLARTCEGGTVAGRELRRGLELTLGDLPREETHAGRR